MNITGRGLRFSALLSLPLLLSLNLPLSGQTTVVPGDNDTSQQQLAGMDRFLDLHPEIAEQLRRDPSLINNREFVSSHPALQEFLQQHPGIREEFSENPQGFMHQERRFEHQQDAGDMRRVAGMDNFLDNHQEIAEQLRRDPSLIRNDQFVRSHPELQEFLQQHPGIREEFSENPQAFMHREDRFDQHEGDFDQRDKDRRAGENDLNRRQIAGMDNFLDNHPEVAEQLRKDPSLIRNERFVHSHPELQEFLQQHQEMRAEFSENPQAFMRREERYDRHEDRFAMPDHDMTRSEVRGFSEFLGAHSILGQQLAKDPSLANNTEYLASHGDLRDYLQAHPGVKEELTENPQAFMSAVQQNSPAAKEISPKQKKKSQ